MSLERDFDKLDRQIDRVMRQSEKNIGKEYSVMLKELRHKLSDWFSEHADGEDRLTLQQMQKYNRLEKFNKEVGKLAREKYTPIAREIRKGIRRSLTESFDQTKDIMESAADRKIRGVLKDETIQAIAQTPDSGLKLNERLQRRRADIEVRIRETLTQGMRDGERYSTMSKRLEEEIGVDSAKAKRIIRTEGHRVQEEGKRKSLEHASNQGVKMVKWWKNSQDERVRDKHEHMGQKYSKDNAIPFEEDFVNDISGGEGPAPGQMGTAEDDIHCRCVAIYEVVAVGEEKEPEAADEGIYTGEAEFTGKIYSEDGEKVKEFVKSEFGEDVKLRDVARATGAHGDEDVSLNVSADDTILFEIEGVDYSAKGYIEPWHKDKHLHIDLMKSKGGGHAAKMIGKQCEHLPKLGVDKIALEAAGIKDGWNGYYTWARLGFDAKLEMAMDSTQKELLAETAFSDAKTMQDIMMHPDGPDWWKEHGSTWSGVFDVTPGSVGRQVLAMYLKRKGF